MGKAGFLPGRERPATGSTYKRGQSTIFNSLDPLFVPRVGLPFEFSFEPAHLPGRNLLPAAPAIKAVRAEYSRHDACPLLGCDCTRQANSRLLGGDLNPIVGFCFPLFSMVFAGEFPSGWKSMESTGSKSLVFFGQPAYKVSMCCEYCLPFHGHCLKWQKVSAYRRGSQDHNRRSFLPK